MLDMSDQELGKRMWEDYHLELFLSAREHATGQILTIVGSGESPDYVVKRPTGSYAGLELTAVYRDPPHDPAWRPRDWWADAGLHVYDGIFEAIDAKSQKLRSPGWKYKLQTILVITLMDVPLDDAAPFLKKAPQEEMRDYGFVEIWVADMSPDEIDAFGGDIRLFGLYPKKRFGFYERYLPFRKPYG